MGQLMAYWLETPDPGGTGLARNFPRLREKIARQRQEFFDRLLRNGNGRGTS